MSFRIFRGSFFIRNTIVYFLVFYALFFKSNTVILYLTIAGWPGQHCIFNGWHGQTALGRGTSQPGRNSQAALDRGGGRMVESRGDLILTPVPSTLVFLCP